MRRRTSSYSRMIGLLKVGLPLAALALLSLLFLVARTLNPEDALPWATVDIQDLLRDPRLNAPDYAGVTREGDEALFTAQSAWPASGEGEGARARDATFQLIPPEGEPTRVDSDKARIDPVGQTLVLQENVVTTWGEDYRLTSAEVIARLDRSHLLSPGAVEGFGPQLRLDAGRMSLERGESSAAPLAIFSEGVRLVYYPDPASPPPQP